MVIALCAVLATPVAAADPCPRAQVHDGCNLDVAVSTYIKDADGNFTPQTSFNPPGVGKETGDCFYVNAVVVNSGNDSANYPVNATIILPSGVSLALGEPDFGNLTSTKTWPGNQGDTDLLPGRIADFWWKVCCTGASGNQTIVVDATAGPYRGPNEWDCAGTGSTWVVQEMTGPTKCVEIKIVEAPGLGNVTGRLFLDDGVTHVVYHSSMPQMVNPCTNFGIKVEITNLCPIDITYPVVLAINYSDWGKYASLVGDNPDNPTWTIGPLKSGQTKQATWTIHCDEAGDIRVNVTAENIGKEGITQLNMPWTVYQGSPGGLVVKIIKPTAQISCETGGKLLIKQPTGGCGDEYFDVQAMILNTGKESISGVRTKLTFDPCIDWVKIPGSAGTNCLTNYVKLPSTGGYTIGPMGNITVDFGNVICTGEGIGNLTVEAWSDDMPVTPGSDYLTISQQKVIAKATPGLAPPQRVNICDPVGFDVSFRYYNYSGADWPYIGEGNSVTACIDWDGNVTLESVYWRKNLSGQPLGDFVLLNGSPSPIDSVDCEVMPQVICSCCSFDVKWHFKCTDEGKANFVGNVTVSDQTHDFYGGDTSEPVCITQEWKAELWTDIAFFIQDSAGVMIEQDAVTPNTPFHVVIPVINTGDAAAENVKVYFTIADAPKDPCTKSYDYNNVLTSGDASIEFHKAIDKDHPAWGIATFAKIKGHSTAKAILLLNCICEGQVSVVIPEQMPSGVPPWNPNDPGMRATDANTHLAVPWCHAPCQQNDIHVPPCPMVMKQIPFTIRIENPYTCQSFNTGDPIPVKAWITNGSENTLVDVEATLTHNPTAEIELMGSGQAWTKPVGNISAGSSSEITWMLQCTGGGSESAPHEVYLGVSASTETPNLTTYSDNWPETVNVHQIKIAAPILGVQILSPQDTFSDQPPFAEINGTYIGTGEQFPVTALVYNGGDGVAEDVTVTIATRDPVQEIFPYYYLGTGDGEESSFRVNGTCVTTGSVIIYSNDDPQADPYDWQVVPSGSYTLTYDLIDVDGPNPGPYTQIDFNSPPAKDTVIMALYLSGFSLKDGEEQVYLGDIAPHESVKLTWTLVGETTCMPQCYALPGDIMVVATGTNPAVVTDGGGHECAWDELDVVLYPAAHLVATIGTISPVINVCDEFNVSYTVTNIGQADAWNASVTLSVDPAGSVRIAGGETGYTQPLGTIVGWGRIGDRDSVTGTFKLHCKMACESTITITPMGYDECGYGPVLTDKPAKNGYVWVGVPGTVIVSKFLEPASKTVKQLENGLDIAITKSADKSLAPIGTTVKFTVTVTNNGPIAASGIGVVDTWTPTSAFTAPAVISKSQGSLSAFTSTGFTWTVGSLPVNGTATLVYTGNSNNAGKITNTATVTSAEADGILDNNTAKVELNVVSMPITLGTGWNLISMPLIPQAGNITAQLAGLGSNWAEVWAYDRCGGGWTFCYRDPLSPTPTLTRLVEGAGYWIRMTAPGTLTVTGVVMNTGASLPPSFPVCVGWNLIGFKSTTAKTAGNYLEALRVNGIRSWTMLYAFDSVGGYTRVVTNDNMVPGKGYWIAVTDAGTIYP